MTKAHNYYTRIPRMLFSTFTAQPPPTINEKESMAPPFCAFKIIFGRTERQRGLMSLEKKTRERKGKRRSNEIRFERI